LKNYFALTNKSSIIPLGQYENFSEAFDENQENNSFNLVWIFSENNLKNIQEQINNVLGVKNE
jgi:hypothetical protein